MKLQPCAKIISYNNNCNEVCASAARISTTLGSADEIFEKAIGNPRNLDLIAKVLKSGHKSLIEHAVFTIAFWNVSAFVEQYLIECRLASFTVKSRRYVDFSKSGYYTPPDLSETASAQYQHYMDLLFSTYGLLLDEGVPKEDARFVLPYSFHSSFYCTINARELAHLIFSIKYGRGRNIPELHNLAEQLISQVKDIFPCLLPDLDSPLLVDQSNPTNPNQVRLEDVPHFIDNQNVETVTLVNAPTAPLDILRTAYQISRPGSAEPFRVEQLITSTRPRELEQLTYSFSIADITLSGITHIVRHRMQSIIIPSIQSVNHSRYIAPSSIKSNPKAWETYKSMLSEAHKILQEIVNTPQLEKFGYYFAVSGNLMNIMTTMNARELELFIQLRTCNRAQWEIQGVAISLLRQLQKHCPELYDYFGPSCYLRGLCPEGTLSCGRMAEVCTSFATNCTNKLQKT